MLTESRNHHMLVRHDTPRSAVIARFAQAELAKPFAELVGADRSAGLATGERPR
jgi:hypothetical protein